MNAKVTTTPSRLISGVVIARRPKADAAISNRPKPGDCFVVSLAMTSIVLTLTEYYDLEAFTS